MGKVDPWAGGQAHNLAAHVASEVNERLGATGRCSNMAQPSTGPGGSGQAAGARDSRDEGDGGGHIGCAAVLVSARKNIDRGPID